MKITSQSADYSEIPKHRIKHYVRFSKYENKFLFCEVDNEYPAFDVRQGEIEEHKLPANIVIAAKERCGEFPSYVEWQGIES